MRQTLGVIIITKNEEKNIERCLRSVAWADEIIVLDSGSTDATVEIAKNYTHHTYQTDWPGFGVQKQRALDKCTTDWVLSVDADEEITPELQNEIMELLKSNPIFDGYEIQRKSQFCNKWIEYGDWGSDWLTRLWRKENGSFDQRIIHEKVVVNGKVGKLKYALLHYTYTSLDITLGKMNSYSSLGAELLFKEGKRSSVIKALYHSFWSFLRGYILRLGFLDGWQGFVIARINSLGSFYKYIKLLEKWEARSQGE